jgi:cytochrome o ubiquinol oxidase subunit III
MMTSEAARVDAAAVETHEEEESIANQAFGFWLYLMSDLVLFAAIFATYGVLAHNYAGGPTGKELFDLPYTFGETMLLLFSSATCGLAILNMHDGRQGRVVLWLAVTFLLGLGFITMEVHEFRTMILEGNGPERSGFLSAFFTLVSTHGLHVASGLIWMTVMIAQVILKGLTLPVQSRLMRLSMFWHFLDIVWVAVFTIVYLVGVL